MILCVEPFYGGSHRQLMDLLCESFANDLKLVTMTAKKWHWRARISALHLSQEIPENKNFRTLFTSSVLNLAELVALRPDLGTLKKVLYFHENQLIYPKRQQKERDFQYGYNQILSCLVADVVVFNSLFNMNSFLDSTDSFFSLSPDYRPKGLAEKIRPKCQVLYFPIALEPRLQVSHIDGPLHIVWPHRWEHDKGPEVFFRVLVELDREGIPFHLSILGQGFSEVPAVFDDARVSLASHIKHFGFLESKEDYFQVMNSAHVCVSTAVHEFYGVAMLEGAFSGCFPLCPDQLSYPEIFPPHCLYRTEAQLLNALIKFAQNPNSAHEEANNLLPSLSRFTWASLKQQYLDILS